MCSQTEFCCLLGPTGLLLRGTHLTTDGLWHQEVGALIAYTMLLQLVSAAVSPLGPAVQYWHASRQWRKQLTLVEMINVHTGAELDLPKYIGKAFAFFFVVVAFGAALPILYVAGVLFFASTWCVQRWALLRVHRLPPAYHVSLMVDTLWWVEVAASVHLFLGCWSYANVPSNPYGSDTWTPPFVNGTKVESSFIASVTGANSTGGAVGGWSDGYNISGHVNSYGTLLLFVAASALIVKILLDLTLHFLSLLLPVPRDSRALWNLLSSRYRKARALLSSSVQPNGEAPPVPPAFDEAPTDGDLAIADSLELDGDPIFSKALVGVSLNKVRSYQGGVVHVSNVSHAPAAWRDSLAYANPLKLLFAATGLQRARVRLTPEQWQTDAKPLPAQLTGSSNISYEPEYSPHYSKAYEYMAPTYVLDEAVKVFDKPEKAVGEADDTAGTQDNTEESDDDDDDGDDTDDELTIEARYVLSRQSA